PSAPQCPPHRTHRRKPAQDPQANPKNRLTQQEQESNEINSHRDRYQGELKSESMGEFSGIRTWFRDAGQTPPLNLKPPV
ncbi:hypothetical protein AruPA_15480, partial [Acidiphilium sp. PA]|uniref:hypothetical protein n=1 Tax=Acidiphilium sp. PA TaxID=2871705 RepID=UPI00224443DE